MSSGLITGLRARDLYYRGRRRMPSKACLLEAEISNVSETDVPVRLNCVDYEIWIHPGDIIIGDADGVVRLPRLLVSDVLKLLPELVSGNEPLAIHVLTFSG